MTLELARTRLIRPLRALGERLEGPAEFVRDRAEVAWGRFRRRQSAVVLKPYTRPATLGRWIALAALCGMLGAFCLVYGFFFALTAPYLITEFLAPVGLLAVLCIWALPNLQAIPIRTSETIFLAFIVGLILWPNYLAIALPGLPWITVNRLTGIPMALTFLICVSGSVEFRRELAKTLHETPWLSRLMIGFIALQFVTIPFSHELSGTVQRVIIQQVDWTVVFFASCFFFRKPGRVARVVCLLCLIAVPVAALTAGEFRHQGILWAGHVPSFLRVDDAARILQASVRSADGLYRAKSTFSTPLGLAEYMAFVTPFLLHYMMGRYPVLVRMAAAAGLPVAFICIRMSGSRLGIVGMLVSSLCYFFAWGYLRWRRKPADIIAPAVVLGYPFMAAMVVGASFFVRRLHVMIFGGGAAKASNEARMHQLHMAIPKILGAPWGHGAGQSGVSMGYGSGQFIALDNYYILIGLDYGVLGLITFYGMIIAAIVYGAFSLLRANTRLDAETDYLVPLVVMLAEFLVIKWVFGQADSHPIVFMVLGMIVALVGRANATAKAKPERIRTTAPRRRTAPASLTPAREPEMAAFGAEDADSPFAVGRSRAPRPVRT